MSRCTAIVPISNQALEQKRKAELREIKEEIKDVKKAIKKEEINIELGIKLANPNYTIDEIKRSSGLPKHMRTQNKSGGMQDAGYRLADESIKKRDDLEDYKNNLSFQLIIKKKEFTVRDAYKLIRHEAKKVGIKMPRRISLDDSKFAYRKMALLYAPHNYEIYKNIINIPSESSDEKFRYVTTEIKEAYEIIAQHFSR